MASPDQKVLDTLQQPTSHQRFGGGIAAAAIVLVVLALAAGFLVRAGVIPLARAGSGTTTWTTYHDKFGLFTAQYPSTWKLQARTVTQQEDTGINPGFWTQTSEFVGFIDPAKTSGTPASVQIGVYLIGSNAVQRAFYCDKDGPQPVTKTSRFPPRTFNGVSALATNYAEWQIVTSNALIQISAYLASPTPGIGLESSDASRYKGQSEDILNSIRIANTNLLAC